MTLLYLRKPLQSLHLVLWIPSARWTARFGNKFAVNLSLSADFDCKKQL